MPCYTHCLPPYHSPRTTHHSLLTRTTQAVREEMTGGMQEAERRCLDISKQVDAAVGVRLDTERQMREQTNSTITRLQVAETPPHTPCTCTAHALHTHCTCTAHARMRRVL